MFGQQRLFGGEPDPWAAVPLRFRVSAVGRREPATTSLVLAAARARAAAVAGHRAVISASDGTAVVVQPDPHDGVFIVIVQGPGSWPDQCRRLLDEHG